jgi:hypothetical protein
VRASARLSVAGLLATVLATTCAANLLPAGATDMPAVALHGTLMVAHGDNFAGGPMVMQTSLQTTSGVVPLNVGAYDHAQLLALAGKRVSVAGSRISLTSSVTAHAVVATPRAMRIAVVLMRLPGSSAEPVSKASVQASTFGPTSSVADWFSKMSGGQVAVTGTVYGYFNGVKSCDLATQIAAATAAAAGAGYVTSAYDHLVVYTPSQPCGFTGIGWVGYGGAMLNGTMNRGVMEHELGHNLGLLHSGLYSCGLAAPSPSCLVDYGDPTDVMGISVNNRGYNAEHKFTIGWLPASEIRTVTSGTQTVALTASENPLVADSKELIHVHAADGTLLAIDRRASVGYDAGLSGVWIRRVAYVKTDDTELILNHALAAGQTFTAHGVTIKTLSDSGTTASIKVCVGPCGTVTGTGSPDVTARGVVTASKSSTTNTGLRMTVPAGKGVATGHTVVVATYTGAAAGSVSCGDSRGNGYSVHVNSVGTQRLIVCSAHVTTSLPPGTTITTRYPAFSGGTVSSAIDFTGIRTNARVDQTHVNAAATSAVTTGATAMTTHAAEVILGVEMHRGLARFTPSPVYTRVGAARYFSGAAQMTITPTFRVVAATGSYQVGGALTWATPWQAAVLTFVRK